MFWIIGLMKFKRFFPRLFYLIFRFLPACLIIAAIVIIKPALESLRASAESLECYCPSCPEDLLPESGLQALGQIKAEIAGAVKKPGVYELSLGQRRADLLTAAGGLDPEASLIHMAKSFNLSTVVVDGEKIYIPYAWEEQWQLQAINNAGDSSGGLSNSTTSQANSESASGLISINTGTIKELQTLPEIGEKRAQDIIDNRPYASLNELLNKKIISQKIYDTIEKLISL